MYEIFLDLFAGATQSFRFSAFLGILGLLWKKERETVKRNMGWQLNSYRVFSKFFFEYFLKRGFI